jgi:hypothetical protein
MEMQQTLGVRTFNIAKRIPMLIVLEIQPLVNNLSIKKLINVSWPLD